MEIKLTRSYLQTGRDISPHALTHGNNDSYCPQWVTVSADLIRGKIWRLED